MIRLRVLTEAGVALEAEAVSIVAPGELGSFGMLHNHAPLISTLVPGKLTWRLADGGTRTAQIGSGLLEVQRNRVAILTESFSEPAAAGRTS